MSPLQQLEPQPVWQHFDGIRRTPRPSKREEKIVAHVRAWAEQHGFAVRADRTGNLLIDVPATPGYEAAQTVVLQAHLDMVCEKNAGVEHDFDNEPIRVEVKGDWVHAVGTTLGADNGLGAAAALAIAVDPEATHGPLELLLTLDEETGLNGAQALDPALVSGRRLINLDTEEDDAIYIGCAGAGAVEAELPLERQEAVGDPYELVVRGLSGGHSGMDIHENRGNAIKLTARLLAKALADGIEFGLVSLQGGSKANAIPRECFTRLRLEASARDAFERLIVTAQADCVIEFGAIEPHLAIELRAAEKTAHSPLKPTSRDALVRLLNALPHGVIALSREVPGLVETSHNLAIVRVEENLAICFSAMRSSVNVALLGLAERLQSLYLLAGARARIVQSYPGWKPNPESPLVRRGVAVYEKLFAQPPEVKAVHAGLECGILVEKLSGLDAISIGPEIRGAHSPDERARISSVAKFYRFLKLLLEDLATPTE